MARRIALAVVAVGDHGGVGVGDGDDAGVIVDHVARALIGVPAAGFALMVLVDGQQRRPLRGSSTPGSTPPVRAAPTRPVAGVAVRGPRRGPGRGGSERWTPSVCGGPYGLE